MAPLAVATLRRPFSRLKMLGLIAVVAYSTGAGRTDAFAPRQFTRPFLHAPAERTVHRSSSFKASVVATAASKSDGTEAHLPYSPSLTPEQKLKQKREELKQRLLEAADLSKQAQADMDRAVRAKAAQANDDQGVVDADASKNKKGGSYVRKLIRRIYTKITSKKRDNSKAKKKKEKQRSILGSDAFGTLTLNVGEAGNRTIAIAEELAALNPTPVPTYGWKGYGGGDPSSECKLRGKWKLRFTTAADATFPESPKRGKALTSQEIDPVKGTLTNVVDFERGKIKGFRVVVAGEAASDKEIDLTFRRVVIRRESRIPWLFGRIVIPIPAGLLRALNKFLMRRRRRRDGGDVSDAEKRGPFFTLMYIDDDLRMHKTGEGNWFIQSRLH